MTRVCLDSNVLVAAFVARGLCADMLRLVLSEYHLVVPEVVANKLRRVLTTKLGMGSGALEAVEEILAWCEVTPPGREPCPIEVRDPADERVLADAISANAEVLVSGDEDLLDVAKTSPIRILSPRAFMTLARGGRL